MARNEVGLIMAFGIDDAIAAIMASLNLFGNGNQPSFQKKLTFEGEQGGGLSIDPRDMLGQGVANQGAAFQMLLDQLAKGVSVPGAFAQSPPTFTGGGMPMPIGLTGKDPALADPSMLSRPGVQMRSGAQGQPFDPLAVVRNPTPRGPVPDIPPGIPGHDIQNPTNPDPGNGQGPDRNVSHGSSSMFDEAHAALDLLGVKH